MLDSRYTLSKAERIASRRVKEELFQGSERHMVMLWPLRAVFIQQHLNPSPQEQSHEAESVKLQGEAVRGSDICPAVQILVSVPKKRFKHAVDRNRVKRQVREAYRHHKQLLMEAVPKGQRLAVAFIWIAEDHQPSAVVEERVVALLKKIREKITSASSR